ncbi:MAG: CoA transferase subunit A, partial [Chloroflexi bacterium]|nr:CoA transferase subunit A [Chloroflexota bacterium]
MESKVKSLREIVAEIPDEGAHIALGGFAITRNPVAFVFELIRQNKRDLTVSQIVAG